MRRSYRESLMIFGAAVVLGFSYTAITEKGYFQQKKPVSHLRKLAQLAPAMISLEEAKALYDSSKAVFIDARHPFEYQQGHIRGAINVPLAEFEKKSDVLSKLPSNKVLVTYCDGVECNSSLELASKLYDAGLSNVKVFFSGWQEWTSHKLPIESSR